MDPPRMRGMMLILICCLLCITTAAAVTPDQITVTSDQEPIQAGDNGAHIFVETDASLPPVASVTFSYLNSTADPSGALSAATDIAAPYQTKFTSEHAGTAYIQVDIAFADESTDPVSVVFIQDVIPANPYVYENITHEAPQAGSAGPITVRMKDQYGSTITADTGVTITFPVSKEGVGFADGDETVQTIVMPFDADGDCTVSFLAPEKAGPVIISMKPSSGSGLQRLITIDVVGERTPAQITPYIVTLPHYPVTNTCPADGISYFRISYVIRDRFGNAIDNYEIDITTSLGESAAIITGEEGVAKFNYGPKTGMGDVTVTGMAGTTTALSDLSFTGGLSSRFSITINPNNIPSNDADPNALVTVQARVYNDLGTGVPGETIQAWITPGSVNATNTMTQDPGLSFSGEGGFGDIAVTAVTGVDGFATFFFRAGAFPIRGAGGFDPFSRGSATVIAMWDDQTATSPENHLTQLSLPAGRD